MFAPFWYSRDGAFVWFQPFLIAFFFEYNDVVCPGNL